MPSGTMLNQIAIRLHYAPGDELLCESNCHILQFEQGGFAQLSGVVGRPIVGQHGILGLDQLEGTVNLAGRPRGAETACLLGNTHNRGETAIADITRAAINKVVNANTLDELTTGVEARLTKECRRQFRQFGLYVLRAVQNGGAGRPNLVALGRQVLQGVAV